MSEDGKGHGDYAVFLFDREVTWSIPEFDLVPTGRFERRDTFYDEDVIRMIVDPVTGEGSLAEDRP